MNRNRNASNQERDDGYQNTNRGHRSLRNRPNNAAQNYPNLNPTYQNPVDLIRNYNRDRRRHHHEPEENIYERLDGDDEDDDDDDEEIVFGENYPPSGSRNDPNSTDHTYERIDNRPWHRAGRGNTLNLSAPSTSNAVESRNASQYDAARSAYLDASRGGLPSQSCLNRLSRLGRNCFSTENIAYASNRRYVYQLGHNCACPFCRHLDGRYMCHYCHNLRDRLRYHDSGNAGPLGSSRHYIYQVSRGCRCAFCRGESTYARFPVNPARLADTFRSRDCPCGNPANCACRRKFLSCSNPAIYIGRIERPGVSQSVNNPMYASPTIYLGRIERSCVSGLNNLAAAANPTASGEPSTSGLSAAAAAAAAAVSVAPADASPSTSNRVNPVPSTSNASVCALNHVADRQHTCDDFCIRNQSANASGVYQFLGRCDKSECQHGRMSVHWLFMNKWLPYWTSQSSERNAEVVPKGEESREPPESDSDEA